MYPTSPHITVINFGKDRIAEAELIAGSALVTEMFESGDYWTTANHIDELVRPLRCQQRLQQCNFRYEN